MTPSEQSQREPAGGPDAVPAAGVTAKPGQAAGSGVERRDAERGERRGGATRLGGGRSRPAWRSLAFLAVVLLLSAWASLSLGSRLLGPLEVWRALADHAGGDPLVRVIVWELRLPRTLLAAMVGAALAMAGASFQALFRNALADPYVIGASSGAALGATLAMTLGWSVGMAGFGPLPLAAFLGALGAVLITLLLAEGAGGEAGSVASLLLAGTALGAMLSAAVSFLLVWRDQPWFQVFNWLLGSFSGRTWVHVAVGWPYLALSALALWMASRPLDALAGGDAVAKSLGLAVRPARLAVIAAATLAVAVAVAVSGIIGFVGLIAPHAARRLFGAGHRRLLPASGLLGAILLVWADVGARTVLAPVEIPVGIVTALIGGPFFLVLLRQRGGRIA
jgi:iron complex transport system permease protein